MGLAHAQMGMTERSGYAKTAANVIEPPEDLPDVERAAGFTFP
jgi:hypothetical protein